MVQNVRMVGLSRVWTLNLPTNPHLSVAEIERLNPGPCRELPLIVQVLCSLIMDVIANSRYSPLQ